MPRRSSAAVNRLSLDIQAQMMALLVEGNSMRGTSRLLGVTLNTVLRNLVWLGEACQKFHDDTVRHLKCSLIQADEMWSFIYAKQHNVGKLKASPPHVGDAWTWIAIDPVSRLVPAWRVGGHEASDAHEFLEDLASRIPGTFQLSTDQLTHYRSAVEEVFGTRVNYATIAKDFATPKMTPDGKHEQPRYKGDRKASVYGNPDPEKTTTTSIESTNLRVRMSSRRYMRRMNGFSRKLRNKRAAVAVHFTFHNFCRISPPIRVTPAMEIGLTDHVFEVEELIEKINVPATMEHRLLQSKPRAAE